MRFRPRGNRNHADVFVPFINEAYDFTTIHAGVDRGCPPLRTYISASTRLRLRPYAHTDQTAFDPLIALCGENVLFPSRCLYTNRPMHAYSWTKLWVRSSNESDDKSSCRSEFRH